MSAISTASSLNRPPARAAVALFDLDRTITRAGTYTPFLLACAARRGRWRLNLLRAAPAAVALPAGRRPPRAGKARLVGRILRGPSAVRIRLWAGEFSVARSKRVRPGALGAIARHCRNGQRLVLVTAS